MKQEEAKSAWMFRGILCHCEKAACCTLLPHPESTYCAYKEPSSLSRSTTRLLPMLQLSHQCVSPAQFITCNNCPEFVYCCLPEAWHR